MDNIKPKVLVYGHSWVRSMGKLHESMGLSKLIVHYEGRPAATIERLLVDLPNVLTEDYSHMLLFTLISELYRSENLGRNPAKECWVTQPNLTFSPDIFVQSLDKFIKKCEELKPNMVVYLMIPPPLDLNHYNDLQLRDAHHDIVQTYNQNPCYKPFQLANNVLQLQFHARSLSKPQFHWTNKQVFSIQNAIYDIQIASIKNAMQCFYQSQKHTMGKDSYLIDGFHPSSLLVSKIWKRMIDTDKFALKKRKFTEPLVMKVAPLTEEQRLSKEKFDLRNVQNEGCEESSKIQSPEESKAEFKAPKRIKLSDNSALDEFVEAETERLIYYIFGFTTGKGLNLSTSDVASLISQYLARRT